MPKDKRVEVLFETAEYRRLEDAAHREGKSVGAVVREAVARYTLPSEEKRQAALRRLATTDTGIDPGSPEDIKAEIIRGLDDYLEQKLNLNEAD